MGEILYLEDGQAFWKKVALWLSRKTVSQSHPNLPNYPLWHYVKMWNTPTRGSIWIGAEDMYLACTGRHHGIDIHIFEEGLRTRVELRGGHFVTPAERELLRRLAKRINAAQHFIILEG